MLINYVRGDECRIAIANNDRLEELFTERASAETHVGNIYRGKVVNIEPSIQAAFIDFGMEKNGFLHVSDLHPQYFHRKDSSKKERVGRKTPRRERPPIQKCLRQGQELTVQVIKEGIGSKGPTLTTYISIPGRYLVMMPGMNRLGVSRKIEDEDVRKSLREIVSDLNLPADMGFIIRTAGIGRSKRELQRDLNYLVRLWKVVKNRMKSQKVPAELYQESDIVTRTIRDMFSTDIEKVIVDDPDTARKVRDFLGIVMPRHRDRVHCYEDKLPVFHKYGIEEQIVQINSRRVDLPSGGCLVIDQTEALVAIDVNSGKFRPSTDPEQMARDINLEAADELVRQLRLRDLGGLIIIDFIDMRSQQGRRDVERRMRELLKADRAKTKMLRISALGIIEMTRQRVKPSLARSLSMECPYCAGAGQIRIVEAVSLDIIRQVQLAMYHKQVEKVQVYVTAAVSDDLQNRRRRTVVNLEQETGKSLSVFVATDLQTVNGYVIKCFDSRQREVTVNYLNPADGQTSTSDSNSQPSRRPRRRRHSRSEPVTLEDELETVREHV